MSDQREAPPPGVEIIPDDVSAEMDKIEIRAHKKLVQKIMDDHEFGQKLIDDPAAALDDPALAEELGLSEEVEGHARWVSKWRYKCYYTSWYGWAHLKIRRGSWVWVF